MTPSSAEPGVDADVAHQALDHLGRAEAIATVTFGGTMLGTVARTVATVSHEPPRVMVALEAGGQTVEGIDSVGSFALNLTDGLSDVVLDAFSTGRDGPLVGLAVSRGSATGQPLLGEVAAQLECVTHDVSDVAGLRIYVADVVEARARTGASLRTLDPGVRSLVASRDDATYQEMRRAILERSFPLEDDIRVEEVVARLGVDRSNVTYALARLAHEGLVTRRTSDAYLLTPVDEGLIRTLLHARRILMIGVTHCLIEELTDDEIGAVVDAAEATRRPAGTRDVGMENDRSVTVFRTFNEVVVGLAGNAVLLDTYRRLSVPTVMGRVLWRLDWSTLHDGLSEQALEFAGALAARDRDRATAAIREFNDRVHDYAVGVLESTGGRL